MFVYICDMTMGHFPAAGKFGKAVLDSKGRFTGTLVDPVPPIAANYKAADTLSKEWASVVFHCAGTRVW